MRLTDLEPEFLKYEGQEQTFRNKDVTMAEANGLWLLCPVCIKDVEQKGCHGIICWNGTVPRTMSPGPGRWNMQGTGFHDLTLVGHEASSSVHLTGLGCGAHFHITNGDIVWA